MPVDHKLLSTVLSNAYATNAEVRSVLVAAAARDIVDTAGTFAPDTDDFRDAIHVDGPKGIHALIVVEDELAVFFGRHPRVVNAMRDSIEWDEGVRSTDTLRAALALVNEAVRPAEQIWAERLSEVSTPAFR